MVPATAVDLLRSIRQTLGEGWQGDRADAPMLLIGMDLVKDTAVLLAAYDDAQGITARFNLNLAVRINRELGGDIPIDALVHRAVWNDAFARVEMHLEAARDIDFTVAEQSFTMQAGETIHTENSHKFTRRSAAMLLQAGGWTPLQRWQDDAAQFSVILAYASEERSAP
jgi:uncharacterized SAM-dependent methyltransferase